MSRWGLDDLAVLKRHVLCSFFHYDTCVKACIGTFSRVVNFPGIYEGVAGKLHNSYNSSNKHRILIE